jgi:hypothetical protein
MPTTKVFFKSVIRNFLILLLFFVAVQKAHAVTSISPENLVDSNGAPIYSRYRSIIPTLYYIPYYNLDRPYSCTGKDRKIPVRSTELTVISTLCATDVRNCMMQGSCVIISHGKNVMINYRKLHGTEGLFVVMDTRECPYGRGPQNVCLEPFHTVAADLNHHAIGDVIYVPELKGKKLPNGEIHDGFFIVRDTGGRIVGQDRFDFYTGFTYFLDPFNPFKDIGLQDKNTRLHYLNVVSSQLKNIIQTKRQFPSVAKKF